MNSDLKKFSYLEGLEFSHGQQDCYGMLVRVYKDFLQIDLTNYARPDDWWVYGGDLYVDNFAKEGFYCLPDDYPLQDIKPFDVFLVSIPDNRSKGGVTPTNHCAIYLGEGKIIHHRYGKRSCIRNYDGAMRNYTTHILRHKAVRSRPTKVDVVDLRKYILPHKRAMIDRVLQDGL